MRRVAGPVALAVAAVAVFAGAQPHAARAATRVLPGTSCPVFPANNVWHADISKLPVHYRSAQWMGRMQTSTRKLHPDFGGATYGIPVTVVAGTHAKVRVSFEYADESDHVGYPLGSDTRIEGGANSDGDRHAIVVDRSTCRLYETYATRRTASGWTAGSGATWSLTSNALRPRGWTSADAAGLPILPGLLRYDEVRAGLVDHAIRFTTDQTSRGYLWPARHFASNRDDPKYPPMGARFRLKAGFSLASYRADTQVVLRAMKKHGLVLADNGSPWFFQGATTTAWPDALIADLKRVPASAFEAVDVSSLRYRTDSGAVRP
jgi:hypothetical protein